MHARRDGTKVRRYDADGKLVYLPENRMKENIGCRLIWYGWAVTKGLPWIVSCVVNVFFGLGCILVLGAVTTMLTEFTPQRSSSGVALNNFLRSTLA